MVVVLFVVLNVVLLLLLLVALALLRTPAADKPGSPHDSGRSEDLEVTEATAAEADGQPESGPSESDQAAQATPDDRKVTGPPPTGPVAPLARGDRPAEPLKVNTLRGDAVNGEPGALFAVDRPAASARHSYIHLTAGLDGDRAARDQLVCGVVEQLRPLGFSKTELTPTHCLLTTDCGETAAIRSGRLDSGEDRIELVVDHGLASAVLDELSRWHEAKQDDRVQISARIR